MSNRDALLIKMLATYQFLNDVEAGDVFFFDAMCGLADEARALLTKEEMKQAATMAEEMRKDSGVDDSEEDL